MMTTRRMAGWSAVERLDARLVRTLAPSVGCNDGMMRRRKT